jgi:hypothetical protein
MNSQRILSIVVAVLGLLLTCCLCPLLVDILTRFIRGIDSPYTIFSTRIGNLSAASYVIASQDVCALGLALIVFIVGIVMFALAMRSSK